MPTLTDIQGKNWSNPDPSALASVLSQVQNPTVLNAAATLKLDTGEYITIHPTREATFGDGRDLPATVRFSTWEDMLAVWLKLFAGDLAAVREVFGPAETPLPSPSCSSCNVAMAIGYIPDFGRDGAEPSIWYPGTPQRGFAGNIKRPDSFCYQVTAFRCPNCGRLDYYALQPA